MKALRFIILFFGTLIFTLWAFSKLAKPKQPTDPEFSYIYDEPEIPTKY